MAAQEHGYLALGSTQGLKRHTVYVSVASRNYNHERLEQSKRQARRLAAAASILATCCVLLLSLRNNGGTDELEQSDPTADPLFVQAQTEQDSLPSTDPVAAAAAADPLVAQARAEQESLPTPAPLGEDHLTDAEKKLVDDAKKIEKEGYIDAGVNNTLQMSDKAKEFLNWLQGVKAGNHSFGDPISKINVSTKVDPIDPALIAAAKQAEDEMIADDNVGR